MGHKAGIGAIFGIVSEEGVVKPDSPVVLLDRENKKIIRRQNTDVNGGFTFNGLNDQEATYMVVATDEDGAEPKNALIQDRILPVPAYSGATLWANWEYVARRDGALTVWSGEYHQTEGGNILPYDSQTLLKHSSHVTPSRLLGVGTASLSVNPSPAGAPHIPAVRFTDVYAQIVVPHNPWELPKTANNSSAVTKHSLECTINLQSIVDNISLGVTWSSYWTTAHYWTWFGTSGTGASNPGWYSRLAYYPGSRTLRVTYRHGDASSTTSPTWNSGVPAGTLVNRDHVFSEGEVPEGLVHIAYTLDPGVRLALFVNGVIVKDWDLAGESPYLPVAANNSYSYGWNNGAFIISGAPTSSSPISVTDGEFGPYAWYPYRLLTDAEVVEHYTALYDSTVLPKLTGYVKEVITDRPAVYARLDDLQADVTAFGNYQVEFMRASMAASHPNDRNPLRLGQIVPDSITLEQASPVVGGMSTVFSGGYLRGDSFFTAASGPDQFTIEFIITPSETPVNGEQIVRFNSGSTPYIWVNTSDTRTLSLGYRLSNGTNETIPFSAVLPFDGPSHVALVLDKVNMTVKQYINGELQDTIVDTPLTTVLLSPNVQYASLTTNAYFYIAGSTTGTSTFKGMLCEVAFYSRALPASRVLAHYNARLIP